MYSARVLEHLENPRHIGEVVGATVRGESFNPVCGDRMTITLRIDDGVIHEACFLVDGCPPSIAAGSVLTGLLIGLPVAEATRLTPRRISTELDGLPRNKEHCAILAIDGLRSALAALPADKRSGQPVEDRVVD
jgi:NifU-like protein involved in Fe-S cluster formation